MLMSKYFDVKYYNSLSDTLKARLLACCKSGAENHDSGVGVYAMQPSDYDDLKPYFDQVIRGYHKIPGQVKVSAWKIGAFEGRRGLCEGDEDCFCCFTCLERAESGRRAIISLM